MGGRHAEYKNCDAVFKTHAQMKNVYIFMPKTKKN